MLKRMSLAFLMLAAAGVVFLYGSTIRGAGREADAGAGGPCAGREDGQVLNAQTIVVAGDTIQSIAPSGRCAGAGRRYGG